ncbi:hypothetical protein FCL49_21960 [Serratia proteamaculans]|nr:hypothetical protein [Serratia proteamaculans]NTZ30753.1 hypothetical protein [Serratia proteamaculans]
MLTKQEKAWFFLLCSDQPKINKLIFLIFIYRPLLALVRNEVCHQLSGRKAAIWLTCSGDRLLLK